MKKIAIIDDDLTLCNAWSQWLSRNGYDPVVLGYCRDFLEVMEREKPDLMMIDIILPGMNGIQIAKSVKQHPTLKHTPVVLMSAVIMKTEIESFGIIADGFLSKPFKMGEMLSVLEEFLGAGDEDDDNYDTQEFSDTKEFMKPPIPPLNPPDPPDPEQKKEKPASREKDASGRIKIASYNVSYDGTKVEMMDVEEELKDNPFQDEPIGDKEPDESRE